MPRYYTDQEFIELWRTHKSAARIAEASGLTLRGLHARRRRIEQRYGIKLEVTEQAARFAHLQTAHTHSARVHLGLEDGIVLIFSDAHFHPGIRTTAYDGLIWAIRELQPKVVICNGDAFDGAQISRHPRIQWDEKPSVVQELKACEIALGEIEDEAKRARKGVKLIWPAGNHDLRLESRLAQNAPEFQGVKGFTLKDHFPAWAPCWACWPTDDVVVKHRWHNGLHGVYNNTLKSGKSIFTGHLHSLKVTPWTDYGPGGSPRTRYGVDTGTLADPEGPQFIDYTEDGPKNWRSGFSVATFHKGRLLWPELVSVFAPGQVEFRGKLIDVGSEREAWVRRKARDARGVNP
jgi:hypothetical protein